MPRGRYILFAGDASWRIASAGPAGVGFTAVEVGAAALPESFAGQVRSALTSLGYGGGEVVLAIPSGWCFSATVPTDDVPRSGRRLALLYRLEAELPLAAEDLVADFTFREAAALGVAAPSDRVRPLVKALQAAGVSVAAACPAAFLAIAGIPLLSLSPPAGTVGQRADVALLSDGDRMELFTLEQGAVVGWYTLPAAAGDVALPLAAVRARRKTDLHVATFGMSASLRDEVSRIAGVASVASSPFEFDRAVAESGARVIAGSAVPMIDLLRGIPGAASDRRRRRPLVFAIGGAGALLACLILATAWCAHRYAQLTEDLDARKVAIFTELFPGEGVPPGISARLMSVERRLRSAGGATGGNQIDAGNLSGGGVSERGGESALLGLRLLLTSLPADVRYRVSELQIDSGKLTLRGQVASHADADAIAAALRRGGLSVDAPQTRQLAEGGVEFILTGERGRAAPVAGVSQ